MTEKPKTAANHDAQPAVLSDSVTPSPKCPGLAVCACQHAAFSKQVPQTIIHNSNNTPGQKRTVHTHNRDKTKRATSVDAARHNGGDGARRADPFVEDLAVRPDRHTVLALDNAKIRV